MFHANLLSPTEPPSLMNLSGVNESGWGGEGFGVNATVYITGSLVWVSHMQTHTPGLNSLAIANILAAFLQETAARYRLLSLF